MRIMISCALCGAPPERHHTWITARDLRHGVPGEFRYVRCRGCGLVFMNPRPPDHRLSEFYEDVTIDYYAGATDGHAASRAQWLQAHGPGRRLLEVGTGSGAFLKYMKDQGWNVIGVEMQEQAARRQRDNLGLDVRTGTLKDAALVHGSLDAAAYWDVFEHLPHPDLELDELFAVLAPGAVAVFSMPNIMSLEARFFGPRWYGLEAPRHLYHYSPRTFRAMANKAGFQVAGVHCSTTATGIMWSLAPRKQIQRQLANGEQAPARAPGKLGAILRKAAFYGILTPGLRLCDAAGMGGHFICILKKPE